MGKEILHRWHFQLFKYQLQEFWREFEQMLAISYGGRNANAYGGRNAIATT
ncbi:hypothetical protein [Nostoc sp. UHCC 0870]|uniref:hypothetical protein n=1 Tax=Nostoc sp. UHCC 0870 TaxID=2914041 RepID=UPI001EE00B0B|nr:hypothetical protein [Nostoc sp. UHCC 0870]UKP00370.1 hypothetical protein L6494_12000 [Nostoc sp. UHCC 0870]